MLENDARGNEDAFVNDDKPTTREIGEKGVRESSNSLSFCKSRERLPQHSFPLIDRLKDKMVQYIDLF